jgi:hypothetical protein
LEEECQHNAGATTINDATVSLEQVYTKGGDTVEETQLLACLVSLRRQLQEAFRDAIHSTFQATLSSTTRTPESGNSTPVSASLEYPAVERLFVDFVTGGSSHTTEGGVAPPQACSVPAVTTATPALVSAVLRGAVEGLAPGFLVPGARIDEDNLLLLDSASYLLGLVSIRVCNAAATAISSSAIGVPGAHRAVGRALGERVRRR